MGHHVRIFVYDMPTNFTSDLLKEDADFKPQHKSTRTHAPELRAEVAMHQMMLHENPLRTMNASDATLYFIPVYATTYCEIIRKRCAGLDVSSCPSTSADVRQCSPGKQLLLDAVQWVRNRHSWLNSGRRHIMTAMYDYGPCYRYSYAVLFKRPSILADVHFLAPNGDRGANPAGCYNAKADVVVPMWVNASAYQRVGGGANRKWLALFRGSDAGGDAELGGAARNVILDQLARLRKDVLISRSKVSHDQYVRELQDSTFCLCPAGWALWTFRLWEAIAAGCIPVLFDGRREVLPFEDLLDYDAAVVRASSAVAVLDMLAAMTPAQVERKQRMVGQLQQWVAYGQPMFTLVLWELYRMACAAPSCFAAESQALVEQS